LILRPTVHDPDILTVGKPDLFQALAKSSEPPRHRIRRSAIKETYYRHRWLLRARRERPRGRCTAAEQDDEFAPSYA
jgi:hypothetical protein